MSEQEADHIRVRVLEVIGGAKFGRCRYPQDLREAAVVYARGRRSEGATVKAICRELGLRYWTLHKWLRSGEERFLPVKVKNAIGTSKSVPVAVQMGGEVPRVKDIGEFSRFWSDYAQWTK